MSPCHPPYPSVVPSGTQLQLRGDRASAAGPGRVKRVASKGGRHRLAGACRGQPKKEKGEGRRRAELKRVALGRLRWKQKAALDRFAPRRPPGRQSDAVKPAAVPRIVLVWRCCTCVARATPSS